MALAADSPGVAGSPGVDSRDGSDSRQDVPLADPGDLMDVPQDGQADGRDDPVIGSWPRAEVATLTDAPETTIVIVGRGRAPLVVAVVAKVVAGQHFGPAIAVVAVVMEAPSVVGPASVAALVA